MVTKRKKTTSIRNIRNIRNIRPSKISTSALKKSISPITFDALPPTTGMRQRPADSEQIS